jgi:hypothetical protein
MITEDMTIRGLNVILLALTQTGRWEAAGRPLSISYTAEGWLTVFAVVALIISVLLVFWAVTKRTDTERRLEQKLAKAVAANEQLERQIAELNQAIGKSWRRL